MRTKYRIQTLISIAVFLQVLVTVLLYSIFLKRSGDKPNSIHYDMNGQQQNKSHIINKRMTKTKKHDFITSMRDKDNKSTTNTEDKKSLTNTKSTLNAIWRNTVDYPKFKLLTDCRFYFSPEEVHKAKDQIKLAKSESKYLFYVDLKLNATNQTYPATIKDDLLDWQLIDKEQKILAELPIDFELVSLFLYRFDKEINTIKLTLNQGEPNCRPNTQTATKEVRSLLWKTLLNNNTDYYLCNRMFTSDSFREFLYWTTTVWLGYDLSCSTSIEGDDENLTKSVSYATTILCFLVSLKFVWLFSILDVKYIRDGDRLVIISASDFARNDKLFHYTKYDRPCGLQRCLLNLFYGEWACKKCCCQKPEEKLTFFLFSFLAVVGFYRTYFRYSEFQWMMEKNVDVVRASEPIIHLFIKFDYITWKVTDICFSMIPLFFFMLSSRCYYRTYIRNDFFYCFEDEGEAFTGFNERLVSRFNKIKRPSWQQSFILNIIIIIGDIIHFFLLFFPCFSFTFHCFIAILVKNQWSRDLRPCSPCPCETEVQAEAIQNPGTSSIRKICCGILSIPIFICSYIVIIRPLLSSITFLLRVFVYFTLFTLPIRINLFRYTLIIGTAIVYILKYFVEIVNLKTDILVHILEKRNTMLNIQLPLDVENQRINDYADRVRSSTSGQADPYLDARTYDAISEKLLFVKKKIYFFVFKVIIVIMSCAILFEVFIESGISQTATHVKDIIELALFLIGPYAVSIFVRANKNELLSYAEKKMIDIAYEEVCGTQPVNIQHDDIDQ